MGQYLKISTISFSENYILALVVLDPKSSFLRIFCFWLFYWYAKKFYKFLKTENNANVVPMLCKGCIQQIIKTVKNVRIRSFSGVHFPAFGLNTERYGVLMREKTDQKNSEYGYFSRSANIGNCFELNPLSASVALIEKPVKWFAFHLMS